MGCGASKDVGDQNNNAAPKKKEEAKTDATQEKTPLDIFREEALIAHNKKRAVHGAPPIKLSAELNEMAQKYAEHLAKTGKFEHSTKDTNGGAGENLAAHSNAINGEQVTDMWYDEIKDYNWSEPGFAMNTGHFTQVVWKDCSHLGIGMSEKGSAGMHIFVANYLPPGNNVMPGLFEQNVLPLKS